MKYVHWLSLSNFLYKTDILQNTSSLAFCSITQTRVFLKLDFPCKLSYDVN